VVYEVSEGISFICKTASRVLRKVQASPFFRFSANFFRFSKFFNFEQGLVAYFCCFDSDKRYQIE
jgi:hypothetical protein